MPAKILLSFTGFHDPYSKGAIHGEDQPGPILTVALAGNFERVVLFTTPALLSATKATVEAIEERIPGVIVEEIRLPLDDPTDYAAILCHLREVCNGIGDRYPGAELFISAASGTPQMHACWLLLAASGEVPARLLHTRPPQFVSASKPVISEVDLSRTLLPALPSSYERPAKTGTTALCSRPESDGECEAAEKLRRVLEDVGIVGEHPAILRSIQTASACSDFDVPVLITGETGTGKDLFAQLIHRLSARAAGPFVIVNCAAIPNELVESTLFGHIKGAFTNAIATVKGKFEIAHGGTLFLDEIGELPLAAQAKLLRVLEDGRVEPVGSSEARTVSVRVVAATNRRLDHEIQEKRFRQDLYYRLRSAEVRLPALRDRRGDIPRLAIHILQEINRTLRKPRRLSTAALRKLQTYDWPGNVRDLRSTIQRAVMFSAGKEVLDAADTLVDEASPTSGLEQLPEPHEGFEIEAYQSDVRRRLFERALEIANGNQSHAARLLGVKPQAVHGYLKREAVAVVPSK